MRITTKDLTERDLANDFVLEHLEKLNYIKYRGNYGIPGYHIAPHVYQVFPNNESGELFFSRELGNEDVYLTGYYKLVVVCNDDDTLSYYADLEDDPLNEAMIMANRPKHRPYASNHSDMVCGASVVFSGYVALDEIGQLKFLSNESGHYKFTLEESEKFCRYLMQQFNLANICLHDYSQEPGVAYYSLTFTNSDYMSDVSHMEICDDMSFNDSSSYSSDYDDSLGDSSDNNMLDSADNLSMASSGYSATFILQQLNAKTKPMHTEGRGERHLEKSHRVLGKSQHCRLLTSDESIKKYEKWREHTAKSHKRPSIQYSGFLGRKTDTKKLSRELNLYKLRQHQKLKRTKISGLHK